MRTRKGKARAEKHYCVGYFPIISKKKYLNVCEAIINFIVIKRDYIIYEYPVRIRVFVKNLENLKERGGWKIPLACF